MLDAIEATIGTSALLRMYSGSVPANVAATESGTKLVEYALASDWFANAASGAKTLNGLTLTTTAVAGAPTNATHFRIYDSAGTTCHVQGTITATGGGGDMTLGNIAITSGGTVNVTGFTLNIDSNA